MSNKEIWSREFCPTCKEHGEAWRDEAKFQYQLVKWLEEIVDKFKEKYPSEYVKAVKAFAEKEG